MNSDRIWDEATRTPLAPKALVASSVVSDGFTIEWDQPDDGHAALATAWEVTVEDEATTILPATGRSRAIVRGLRWRPDRTYNVRVVAIDERGNRSMPGEMSVMTAEVER